MFHPKTASDQGRDAALLQLGLKIANEDDRPMSPGMHSLVGAGLGGALGAGATYYHLGQGDNLQQLNSRMLLSGARRMRNQPGFNLQEVKSPGRTTTTFHGTPQQMASLKDLYNTSRGFHSGVSGLLGAGAGALGGYLIGKMRED